MKEYSSWCEGIIEIAWLHMKPRVINELHTLYQRHINGEVLKAYSNDTRKDAEHFRKLINDVLLGEQKQE